MVASFDSLPQGSVLLHVGPHKTGTTAIQVALAEARPELVRYAVSYAGRRLAHHREARALRQIPAGWVGDTAPLPGPEVWRRFAREIARTPGRVVASSEFFAQSNADARAKIAADLGHDRLHLVLGARNPGSMALSTWQQVLQDAKTGDLDAWLEERFRRDAPAPATSRFWSWADAASLVERWSDAIDVDRIHVVVLDESDKTVLPSAFESLLGLPDGMLVSRTRRNSNRTLTAPEAELLRQVITLVKDQLTWDQFTSLIRGGFIRRLLSARTPPAGEARPALPSWAAAQATKEADAIIGRLQSSGAHVIGDLECLRAVPEARVPPVLDTIPTELGAEAVAGVVTAAVRGITSATRRASAQSAEVRSVDEVPTRELAGIVAARARSGVLRRVRRGDPTDSTR